MVLFQNLNGRYHCKVTGEECNLVTNYFENWKKYLKYLVKAKSSTPIKEPSDDTVCKGLNCHINRNIENIKSKCTQEK